MKDWRGVEIYAGATVIYGAGVGRSISPTVARVVEVVPSKPADYMNGGKRYSATDDKVRLEVQEYAYGYRSDVTKTVLVMPARVTVISTLPQSSIICPECRESRMKGYNGEVADECWNCERREVSTQ